MANILMQLAKANPMMQNVRQMMGMLNASQNPMAMMNSMVQGNPNLKQVMDFINQSGGDPKKAFYALAEQKGIDPQEILNMLK